MTDLKTHTFLVTGANSGLGFEAAAQLAEAGAARVILAARSQEKADAAKHELRTRTGRNPFETLVIDVGDIASTEAAAAELRRRGRPIDRLLLNAGMVSGETLHRTRDGLEEAFAASVIGHHLLTIRLLEAGLLPKGTRVVLSGSEAANGDVPAMMDMKLFPFAVGEPEMFGKRLDEAMRTFARAEIPQAFRSGRYYATTKVFSAWWAAAMDRRYGDVLDVFTVSPGANMATNAARHQTGFKKFFFTKVMPSVGSLMGMNQPTSKGARRYLDVLLGDGEFKSGATYTSAPKKMTGPLFEMTHPHLVDETRQEAAFSVLSALTRTEEPQLLTRPAA